MYQINQVPHQNNERMFCICLCPKGNVLYFELSTLSLNYHYQLRYTKKKNGSTKFQFKRMKWMFCIRVFPKGTSCEARLFTLPLSDVPRRPVMYTTRTGNDLDLQFNLLHLTLSSCILPSDFLYLTLTLQ